MRYLMLAAAALAAVTVAAGCSGPHIDSDLAYDACRSLEQRGQLSRRGDVAVDVCVQTLHDHIPFSDQDRPQEAD